MPNIDDARRTYIASLAFVPSRDELPLVLNARGLHGCGVEVGVKEGHFSDHILQNWQGAHLISVDPWMEDEPSDYVDIANVPQQVHDGFYERTARRLARYGARSTIWRTTSIEAAGLIPHHSLDFVYIDARHDYDSVLEDLEAWFDKVRPGGIVAGHDYIDGHFPAGIFGVKSAVDEFFASKGLAVCSTLLDEPWLSWMVEIPGIAPAAAGATAEPATEVRVAAPPVAAVEPTPARAAAAGIRQVELSFGTPRGQHHFKLRLDPSQVSQRLMLSCIDQGRFYEDDASRLLAYLLEPGDTFIDVGGHVGYFSMAAASLVGSAGKVFCFEPDASNFARVREHVALNGFDQVRVLNLAVSDSEGVSDFYVNADNDGGHALWDVRLHPFNARSRDGLETRSVETTTLDRMLAGEDLGRLRMIKIDAEGCETAVLRGAHDLLAAHAPTVICEINHFGLEQMGTTETELREFMTGLGYHVYAFEPNTQRLLRLADDQWVETVGVFNLAFIHPRAAITGAAA